MPLKCMAGFLCREDHEGVLDARRKPSHGLLAQIKPLRFEPSGSFPSGIEEMAAMISG